MSKKKSKKNTMYFSISSGYDIITEVVSEEDDHYVIKNPLKIIEYQQMSHTGIPYRIPFYIKFGPLAEDDPVMNLNKDQIVVSMKVKKKTKKTYKLYINSMKESIKKIESGQSPKELLKEDDSYLSKLLDSIDTDDLTEN